MSRAAGWALPLMPLAALLTFPAPLVTSAQSQRLFERVAPATGWSRPPSGCFGQPVLVCRVSLGDPRLGDGSDRVAAADFFC